MNGLSPRLRGNLREQECAGSRLRAIPAIAGEPLDGWCSASLGGGYPRDCGGTLSIQELGEHLKGLSPRLRGNRRCRMRPQPDSWGYPRDCGGTRGFMSSSARISGLSPRLRGNQMKSPLSSIRRRAIPAIAGEPLWRRSCCHCLRGYPRDCGGTVACTSARNRTTGLSPRLRGNLGGFRYDLDVAGAIPAIAGEPRKTRACKLLPRGYPRDCGGTRRLRPSVTPALGLSPRLRGNRDAQRLRSVDLGAIPAIAGEPQSAALAGSACGGYPRDCGGTRGAKSHGPILSGAIPAIAGEPCPSRAPDLQTWGYPRDCGGTSASSLLMTAPQGLSPRLRGNL